MEPLTDTYEISEKEKSDISTFCKILKNYHQRCLDELNALDREVNYQSNIERKKKIFFFIIIRNIYIYNYN